MIKDIREGMEENMEAYHMMDGAEVMGVLVEAVGVWWRRWWRRMWRWICRGDGGGGNGG